MTGLGKWLFRAAGSAVVLALIFWWLPAGEIWESVRRLSLPVFLSVLAAFLAGHCLGAAKWWLLLGRPFPYVLALRAHLAGLAANLCLPGVAGGDAVRAGLVHGAMRDLPRLAAGSVTDRVIDLVALICLAGGALLVLRDPQGSAGLAGAAILVGVVVAGAFAIPSLLPALLRRFPGLPGQGVLQPVAEAFGGLAARPGRLLTVLGLSLGIQGLFVLLSVQLAMAIGVAAPLAAWFFAWPMAKLLAILPVSLGGLGLREASLAGLLSPFGPAPASIVAAGLLWQAVLFTAGGIGALVWTLTARRVPATAERR